MPVTPDSKPRLRPIQLFPVEDEGRRMVVMHDPVGMADGDVVMAEFAVFILMRLDGEHSLGAIQAEFAEAAGQPIPFEHLERLVDRLEEQRFLEGPRFETHVRGLTEAYRAAPARQTQPDSGLGVELHRLPAALRHILEGAGSEAPPGRLVGLVAPHLDLQRGRECYADAYGLLRQAAPIERFVILGTNHFGRSSSAVATTKGFETPLGMAETDVAFLDRLQVRCGTDLCREELDHAREHSIEMQVLFLQYVRYRRPFRIVPILCPDPCGPTGTQPRDGKGVDLRRLAEALADEIREDPVTTCVIAGADLAHVGRQFGDECDLDPPFLQQVERQDREALRHLELGDPEAFRAFLAAEDNPTRICSAGSLYALLTVLNRAYGDSRVSARLMRYHQAVDRSAQTGVTCAAMAFTLKA